MAGRIRQPIYAAAVLGVAGWLADGPMDVEEIARNAGAHDALGDTVYPFGFARPGQLPPLGTRQFAGQNEAER
jgi:hypothetical protein